MLDRWRVRIGSRSGSSANAASAEVGQGAIAGLSFEVGPRESLAVLGPDRHERETLMRLVAGLLSPATGKVERVGSLVTLALGDEWLELRATGRENVRRVVGRCGLSADAARARIEEVAAFADIGSLFDERVTSYPPEAATRLGCTVALLLAPEIIVVGDQLGATDPAFQARCRAKLRALIEGGASMLIASDDAAAVQEVCQRGLVLHEGRAQIFNRVADAVRACAGKAGSSCPRWEAEEFHPAEEAFFEVQDAAAGPTHNVRFLRAALVGGAGREKRDFRRGEVVWFCAEIEALEEMETPAMGVALYRDDGIWHSEMDRQEHRPAELTWVRKGTVWRVCHRIVLALPPGFYTWDCTASDTNSPALAARALSTFQVTDDGGPGPEEGIGACQLRFRVPLKEGVFIPRFDLGDRHQPDFFIVGAAKSATTSLWQYLAQHPDIFMPSEIRFKEPSYFDSTYGVNDYSMYLELFHEALPSQKVGEASTPYLADRRAAQRIHAQMPHARIIILLRNPVDRAFSLYRWMRAAGFEPEATFEGALQREKERLAGDCRFIHRPDLNFNDFLYFTSGLYHEQARRYLETFGPDAVRVMVFEEFSIATARLVRETFRFLGVDDSFSPKIEVHNRGEGGAQISPETRRELETGYREDVTELARLLKVDLSRWWF